MASMPSPRVILMALAVLFTAPSILAASSRGRDLARISHQDAEHKVEKCLSLTSCRALFGVFRVQTALGAPELAWDRTPGMIAAAAYAARGMELPFSMGLRPRLSADAAFAAYSNPGLAPGDYSINPVRLQCRDFGESGEAAVGVVHPRKRPLQVFLIKRRSRAST